MDDQQTPPQGPTPPQYSPDGRWYWNGFEWRPNPQLAANQRMLRRADRLIVVGAVIGAAAFLVLVILIAVDLVENAHRVSMTWLPSPRFA